MSYAGYIETKIYLKEAERLLREVDIRQTDADKKIVKDIEKAICLVKKIRENLEASPV